MDRPQYKLSATLVGHSQDVRCVASSSSTQVLSSSRDSTAKAWLLDPATKQWSCSSTFSAHEGFVGAVAYTEVAGVPYCITGSNDSTILAWDLSTAKEVQKEPARIFIGHQGNVCALDALDGLVASGSWDTTAKIWDLNDPSGEAKLTLTGSELSIWAVKLLPQSASSSSQPMVLTASADKLIRLYSGSSIIQTFKGHSQPVRALALLPPSTGEHLFASAGNDGAIKIWNWKDGSPVKTLGGHDSFVYSLSCTPDGTLLSSGEDRSVRVWNKNDGELQQTITLPAISIWSVAVMQGSDDIIVGSSDAHVRIFSTHPDRQAAQADLQAYEESIAGSAINSNQVGDVKKSDLPDEESLASRTGKKEGEIVMVKTISGSVDAHQWSSAERKWIKVGTVVDAVGSGRKQLYEGQEYDYVFDVDVAEGQPPLKLPYNIKDNPYEAAQKFLVRNKLPASYVDEVVKFIEKNTGGATLGGQGNTDPYTGASSYRSGNNCTPSTAPSQTFGGDPWGSSSSASANASSGLLPHKTFLTFTQANMPAISNKIIDLNKKLKEQPSTSSEHTLSESDIRTFEALVTFASKGSPFKLDNAFVALLEKLLEWPGGSRFPVLDLIRVVALHAPASQLLFQLLQNVSPSASASSKENETNSMLALRGIANMFNQGRPGMKEAAPEALETLSVVGTNDLNKNGKTALATVALNYSIICATGGLSPDTTGHLVDLIQQLAQETEPETLYRSVMAFGNIVYAPGKIKGQIQVGNLQNVKQRLVELSKIGEPRLQTLIKDITQKL